MAASWCRLCNISILNNQKKERTIQSLKYVSSISLYARQRVLSPILANSSRWETVESRRIEEVRALSLQWRERYWMEWSSSSHRAITIISAPLQYNLIFPSGVRNMTDILFRSLLKSRMQRTSYVWRDERCDLSSVFSMTNRFSSVVSDCNGSWSSRHKDKSEISSCWCECCFIRGLSLWERRGIREGRRGEYLVDKISLVSLWHYCMAEGEDQPEFTDLRMKEWRRDREGRSHFRDIISCCIEKGCIEEFEGFLVEFIEGEINGWSALNEDS